MLDIRLIEPEDRAWVRSVLVESWGGVRMVSRGRLHQADELPGWIAWRESTRLGLITYRPDPDAWEIITLNSLQPGAGIGTLLLDRAVREARGEDCRRLWLITTNDNLQAARFYQRRDWRMVAVHLDAVTEGRRLKPELPQVGQAGIPIRDEWEFELLL